MSNGHSHLEGIPCADPDCAFGRDPRGATPARAAGHRCEDDPHHDHEGHALEHGRACAGSAVTEPAPRVAAVAPGQAAHAHGNGHAHDHAHGHAHGLGGHSHSAGGSMRRLSLSLGLTATIMIAEALGGWLSGSLALVSDAGHMLTDAGALGLALVAAWLSSRPPDDKRTYGYRRAEVLAAQLNVGALVLLSVWIAWEAVERLREPHAAIDLRLMSIVAAVGLAANLLILWFLHGEHGINARSAFLHVVSDTVSSVAILIGAGAMALRPDLGWLDPVLSLCIGGLILWGALQLVFEITDILMESVPRHLDASAVSRLLEGCQGVVAVHDLHIWTISSGMVALSAHLVVDDGSVGRTDEVLTAVKAGLRRAFNIDHTTLQLESRAYAHLDDVHRH